MDPFLPRNKRLLNEDNVIILKLWIIHYLKNMILPILVHMILLKNKWNKITNKDDEYREEISKLQDGNESVNNSETSDTLHDDSINKKTK